MANIQIDEKLFKELCLYFFSDENAADPNGIAADVIRKELNDKLDKLISRELFTRYKRAASTAEREAARQEYLDHRGIQADWRTEKEVKYH